MRANDRLGSRPGDHELRGGSLGRAARKAAPRRAARDLPEAGIHGPAGRGAHGALGRRFPREARPARPPGKLATVAMSRANCPWRPTRPGSSRFRRLKATPGHECPGYGSTKKPPGGDSLPSPTAIRAGFSRLFASSVARAFMPGRRSRTSPSRLAPQSLTTRLSRWSSSRES